MGDFSIHGWLGNTAMMYFLFLSIWGYVRFFRKQGLDSNYFGAMWVGEILLVIQVLLGVWLYFGQGLQPARGIHLLYGFLTPALIPAIFFYTRGRSGRAESLAYATALLIAAALVMRAVFTGEVAIP
jgi:hypothetical protein